MLGVHVNVFAPLAVSVIWLPLQTVALPGCAVMLKVFVGAGLIVTTVGVAGQEPTPETVNVVEVVPSITLTCVLLGSNEVKVPALGTQV